MGGRFDKSISKIMAAFAAMVFAVGLAFSNLYVALLVANKAHDFGRMAETWLPLVSGIGALTGLITFFGASWEWPRRPALWCLSAALFATWMYSVYLLGVRYEGYKIVRYTVFFTHIPSVLFAGLCLGIAIYRLTQRAMTETPEAR